MSEVLRRVSVLRTIDGSDSAPVDLALAGGLPVEALIPAVVDLVGGGSGEHVHGYRLALLNGQPLDTSISLDDNGIRDGDALLLSAEYPAPYRTIHDDPCQALAMTTAVDGRTLRVRMIICLWSCLVTVVALGWAAETLGRGLLLTVATLLGLASSAAGAIQHRGERSDGGMNTAGERSDGGITTAGNSPVCGTLQLMSTAFAGLVGFLSVPGHFSAASLFLAAVAALSASVVQLRLNGCDTASLTACAVSAGVVAVSLGGAAMWPVSVAVIGAAVTLLSLAVLGLAPRASLTLSGLSPSMPNAGAGTVDVDMRRVARSHRILTGAVVGAGVSAALGAVLIVVGCLHGAPPWPAAGFTAAAGSALVLRLRSHVDPHRRHVLIGAGIICLTASFVIVIAAAPVVTPWLSVAVCAAAAAALIPLGDTASPMLRRTVDVAEYVSLAALVPLGCWVADVYGLVRGVSLS